jgi:hypothetical protein
LQRCYRLLATSLSAALAPATVFAATTTGTINATLTLTTGAFSPGDLLMKRTRK